jgi:prevent-host-death family protein
MSDTAISVTEAARNFAEYVNRVHQRRQTFVLVKNGVPVARLVPVVEPVCCGRELVEVLARVELSPAEARAWRRDLKAARKCLKPPRDAWE